MNEDLARHFNIAVIEWLIALVILIILAVAGAVVTRQSRRAFRELTVQSSAQVSKPESWHVKSAEAVLESHITTPQGLSGEEITVRLYVQQFLLCLQMLPQAFTRLPRCGATAYRRITGEMSENELFLSYSRCLYKQRLFYRQSINKYLCLIGPLAKK